MRSEDTPYVSKPAWTNRLEQPQLFNLVSNYFRSQALAGGGVAGLFGDGSDGALDIVAPALLGGVLNYTTFSISAAGIGERPS